MIDARFIIQFYHLKEIVLFDKEKNYSRKFNVECRCIDVESERIFSLQMNDDACFIIQFYHFSKEMVLFDKEKNHSRKFSVYNVDVLMQNQMEPSLYK